MTADLKDFADSAALVANLDVVVTADTAVAHLAGALGKPVHVLSRVDASWRWLAGRRDLPWHPRLQVHRQAQGKGWGRVAAEVRDELAALSAARARCEQADG